MVTTALAKINSKNVILSGALVLDEKDSFSLSVNGAEVLFRLNRDNGDFRTEYEPDIDEVILNLFNFPENEMATVKWSAMWTNENTDYDLALAVNIVKGNKITSLITYTISESGNG